MKTKADWMKGLGVLALAATTTFCSAVRTTTCCSAAKAMIVSAAMLARTPCRATRAATPWKAALEPTSSMAVRTMTFCPAATTTDRDHRSDNLPAGYEPAA